MIKKTKNVQLDANFSGHNAKKWNCPSCNQKKFVRYFDTDSMAYLPEEYGRCDREEKCGYFNQPWDYLKGKHEEARTTQKAFQKAILEKKKFHIVPKDLVSQTLQHYQHNNFFLFLQNLIGQEQSLELMMRFYVGTAKGNATIFWQVDQFFQVRTGTKISYQLDGHRSKQNLPVRLFKTSDNYQPCFFGEHQLFEMPEDGIVAIVESEKTAIISSYFLPRIDDRPVVWMACSGLNGLTDEKIFCLSGMEVILVPDCSYAARAAWGLVPMKKKKNEKGQLVPDPDGDLVLDFISATDKLNKLKCTVYHFDPSNDLSDGSDIADLLIENALVGYEPPRPIVHEVVDDVIIEPEMDDLVLLEEPDTEELILGNLEEPVIFAFEGVKHFRVESANGVVKLGGLEQGLKESVEKILSQQPWLNLIKRLKLFEGEITCQKEESQQKRDLILDQVS
jgi:hypothetical protein